MSRLINPGTGDLLDRLSILGLKLVYGQQVGKDTTHFRNERNAILPMIAGKNGTALWLEHYTELAAVNAALWGAEDEMRYTRIAWLSAPAAIDYKEAAQCAFRIQSLNDRRAELIALINSNTGESLGSEKLT